MEDYTFELNKIMGMPSKLIVADDDPTDDNMRIYAVVPDNQGNACQISSFKYLNSGDNPDLVDAAAKALGFDKQNIIAVDHFNAPVVFERPVSNVVCSAGRYQVYYLDRNKTNK